MIKNCLRLLAALIAICAFQASAQKLTGSWYLLPSLGTTYSDIIETPDRTFVLAGGSVMALDNEGESYFFNRTNKLSDSGISKIRYNYQKGYLLIAYSNGNIDLLYDDDHVVNMPDLRDAVLTSSHEIGDIAFGNDRIVVTTDFGIVVFNDERGEVVESGMYGQKVNNAMIMGDNLLILTANSLLWSPLSTRHTRLDTFSPVKNTSGADIKLWPRAIAQLNGSQFVNINDAKGLYIYTFSPDGTVEYVLKQTGVEGTVVCHGKDNLAFTTTWNAFFVNRNDGSISKITIPTAQRGKKTYSTTDGSSVWLGTADGIMHYDFSASTPTLLSGPLRPAAVSVNRPAGLAWSADGDMLYISNITRSKIIGDLVESQQTTLYKADGSFEDISKLNLSNPLRLTTDPTHNDVYYIGSGWVGVRVASGNDVIMSFTKNNSPLTLHNNETYATSIDIDNEGNMWVGCMAQDGSNPYRVLPAKFSKERKWAEATSSDWVTPLIPSTFVTSYDLRALFHSSKPYAVFASGDYSSGYVVLKHNGTYLDSSDDTAIHHTSITDQSNASNTDSRVSALVEDKNGHIWFGTTAGVLVMSNPADAMNPSYNLSRPLVARNDGTNFGDYLLASDEIYCIAVDHTNRKWIGTAASGLYLVSEDGSEIIEHFNENNSPLPSNKIYSVTVNPHGSEVYIGTDAGVFVYNGTSSPASDDYSDVFVYPNPVRPDYTGWITITGLMDNSLVKIADSAGNVIHSGRSEGGSMVWDGCNASGQRVRTGVYFVMASQNQQGNSGVVAKIMVVN